MAKAGAEPLGAMGSDTPVAVLSKRPRLLFDYFTQAFAQVTNPPLDSIREEVVTSLRLGLGPERNLLSSGAEHARQVVLDFPVIDNDELAKIQHIAPRPLSHITTTIRGLYRVDAGPAPCRTGSTRCAARPTRRSRPARSSSCCPTATPPRTSRRSRRC
ncbi:glutamate synthase central domain-containing protein [Rathayibacter oskolensis]|uniref:glutamate synthase central domain-containing protein n=1 Tax=Rathayibacter oskolensis TaxID=1891671 RepID=UPI0034663375